MSGEWTNESEWSSPVSNQPIPARLPSLLPRRRSPEVIDCNYRKLWKQCNEPCLKPRLPPCSACPWCSRRRSLSELWVLGLRINRNRVVPWTQGVSTDPLALDCFSFRLSDSQWRRRRRPPAPPRPSHDRTLRRPGNEVSLEGANKHY